MRAGRATCARRRDPPPPSRTRCFASEAPSADVPTALAACVCQQSAVSEAGKVGVGVGNEGRGRWAERAGCMSRGARKQDDGDLK
eukprot:4273006-Pleurochrysis_carterae.AAC.2